MGSLVRCHSRLSGILQGKDSGQAGVTNKSVILMDFAFKEDAR